MVFCHLSLSLKWRDCLSIFLSLSLMMCLSDANECFLHSSSVSPPSFPFLFFFPSARLICQRDRRKRFFLLWLWNSLRVIQRKTLMTFLISAGLVTWWMEVFKRPDYFCRTVRLSGSQLAVMRECLGDGGRWCKGWKRVGGPVTIGRCLCGFVYLLYVRTSHCACTCGASEVWCEGEPNVKLCTAMTDCTLSQLSCVGTWSHNDIFLHCKKYTGFSFVIQFEIIGW